MLLELAQKQNLKSVAFLTKDLHVWPDFHGNRSPIADSTLKGMVCTNINFSIYQLLLIVALLLCIGNYF